MLLGSAGLIGSALRWRKALGGGMRQSGILAAAGLYALEHHVVRLAEDHANAQALAQGLAGLGLAVEATPTNMIYVTVPQHGLDALRAQFAARGILASTAQRMRLVTHLDLSRQDVDQTVDAFADVFRRAA